MEAATIDRFAFELKQRPRPEYRAAAGTARSHRAGHGPALHSRCSIAAWARTSDLLPATRPRRAILPAALEMPGRPALVGCRLRTGGACGGTRVSPRCRTRSSAAATRARSADGREGLVRAIGRGTSLHPRTQEHIALLPMRCPRDDLRRLPAAAGARARSTSPVHSSSCGLRAPAANASPEDVQVRAGRTLAVAEVIARHQAAARRQAALAGRVISSGTMTLTFEAPGLPAPVTITRTTIIYADRGRTEARAARHPGQRRRVPEARRAAPSDSRARACRLACRSSSVSPTQYRYRLENDDTVNGVRCYVVSFEPTAAASLFNGRAWIAMDDFRHGAGCGDADRPCAARSSRPSRSTNFARSQPGVWLLAAFGHPADLRRRRPTARRSIGA